MNRFRDLFLLILMMLLQIFWYIIGTCSYIRAGFPEGSDFRWLYSGGKIFREYGPSHVYDLNLACVYQAEVTRVPVDTERLLLPNHPPFVFPLVAVLSGLEFRTAYYCFFALVLFIVISSLAVVYRPLRNGGWPRHGALIMVAGVTLFEPFFVSLLKGQDTFLLYLGGLFLLSGWMLEKDWLASLGLGLTLVRPQITLILVIPFLIERRKIWWWFLVSAVVLGLYSFVQIGWTGTMDYFHALSLSTGVEDYGWDEVGMFTLVGFILRVAPRLNSDIVHALGWGVYAVMLVGLCVLLYLSKQLRLWHLALAVSLGLFAVPHSHYHDLVLLAAPNVGLGVVGYRYDKFKLLPEASMLTATSLVFLVAELWKPIYSTFPYILMTVLPILPWWCESRYNKPGWIARQTTHEGCSA